MDWLTFLGGFGSCLGLWLVSAALDDWFTIRRLKIEAGWQCDTCRRGAKPCNDPAMCRGRV